MRARGSFVGLGLMAGLAGIAGAQKSRPVESADSVPKASRPPAGMCRVWLDKVPARQQPAPTDCPTAVKNRPANGKVIFGDDYKEKGGKDDRKELPFLKKFGEDRKNP